MEIHRSARKHDISDPDIKHAINHPMAIFQRGDGRRLYLGPGRDAGLLEIVTINLPDGSELAIHAMKMRSKYRRYL